jgi:peptidoglycan/LPS O-acetylase OafA/YrhL
LQSFPRYNPALDGLRAVAIALVIADHCWIPGLNGGYFGVDLFFVLSGFLITRLLLDEFAAHRRIDLLKFYVRRLLRLTPPLLLLLAAYLVAAPLIWPQYGLWSHISDASLAILYLSDYGRAFWSAPLYLQHTWSLSVEEHFYLVWPFAVLLLVRLPLRWRIAGLVGLYLLATGWRIFEYQNHGWVATYFRADTRMGGLTCGALLATCSGLIGRVPERAANAIGTLACGALVLCVSLGFWRAPWSLVWLTNLAQWSAVGLLVAASVPRSWISVVLSSPSLAGIGIISYGMYLWHYPAAAYLRVVLPWYETVPVVLTFSIIMATASYLMVERPLQRYRRNLVRRREFEAAQDQAAATQTSRFANETSAVAT